jgi:hypothetical protein
VFIRTDGTCDTWCYGYQPTTDDIAKRAQWGSAGSAVYTHVVQLVGEVYEVYDLKTLKRIGRAQMWTIGLPVVTHRDFDAAIMAAVLID